MANITRSEPSRSALSSERNLSFDPFQSMREMLRWDPFSDIFRTMALDRVPSPISMSPMFDLRETNDAFILQADVPGVQEKDLEVSLSNNRLSISGNRESEENKGESSYRSWGSFSRSFTLPTDVDSDKVSAELKNGVLMIQLPKTGEAKAKRIEVRAEKK